MTIGERIAELEDALEPHIDADDVTSAAEAAMAWFAAKLDERAAEKEDEGYKSAARECRDIAAELRGLA